MKSERFILAYVIFAIPLWCFQSDASSSLADRVQQAISLTCFDSGCAPLEERLRALGSEGAVVAILLETAVKYHSAQPTTLEYPYLIRSIVGLGKFGEIRAIPLLLDMARNKEPSIRVYSIQAIGEIDPMSNKQILLTALRDDSYGVRRAAALGLSKLDDPSVLTELEVVASKERSHGAFLEIQEMANTMRVRLNAKPK